MATDWAADVKKYAPNADPGVIAAIVRYCGIALRNRDSSLVAFSDPTELARVRTNYLQKKLALTQADSVLDAAIAKVGEIMKADRTKNRVTVYYLLAAEFGKLGLFAPKGKVSASAAPAAKAPATKAPATKKSPAAKAPAAKATAAKAPATKPSAKTAAAAGVAALASLNGAKDAKSAAKKPAAKAATAKATPAKVTAPKTATTKAAPTKVAAAKPAPKSAPAPAPAPVAKVADIPAATATAAAPVAAPAAAAVAAATAAAATAASAAAKPAAAAQRVMADDEGNEGGLGWLWWLIGLVLLTFAAWWLFGRDKPDDGTAAATATEAAASVDTSASAVTDLAAAPAEGTVTIPAGAGVTSETRDSKPVVKVYFDSGKTGVAPAFADAAGGLKAWIDGHAGSTLQVSGYNDPSGNAAQNAELSKNRAQAVAAELVKAGIAETAVALVKPEATTDAAVSKEAARRVEVTVK